MNSRLKLLFAMVAIASLFSFQAYGLIGSWKGELTLGATKLPIVFNFSESGDGSTQCTLDSPAQGAKGIPATVAYCTSDSISLTCNAIGASYSGRIMHDAIKGSFSQRGYSFPLDLLPEAPIEERRPQTPRPPFPYEVIDTAFVAPDGAVMSATLTMPERLSGNKVPAVLMVSGSGPQNRDEELMDHRPFAVIADYLARNGIASLRYDDRGTGQSTGNFLTATTYTLKDDAKSGIAFLRTIDRIGKTGVLGHSEGGTIAFMLGAENVPDFMISLAGMAISGKETLLRQNGRRLDQVAIGDDDKESILTLIGRVFDTMHEQNLKGESTAIDIDSIVKESGLTVNPLIASSLKMTQQQRSPWIDAFIGLNPRTYLKEVKRPLLAINGDKDTQVYPDNLSVIQELVPQAQIKLMPGLNHLMQHAVTGDAGEYGDIRETISPEVLESIAQFITSCSTK